MRLTQEEQDFVTNLFNQGATNEEVKTALDSFRLKNNSKASTDQNVTESGLTGKSKDLATTMIKAGRSNDEIDEALSAFESFQNGGISDFEEFAKIVDKYEELQPEKTSFEKLKQMGKAGLMDYVAEGIRVVGKPVVEAAEFVEEKAIAPAVGATVGAMEAITAPVQSGLRKLIGEDNIVEMQADIDSTLENASGGIKKWWDALPEETKERNKLVFDALMPVLMVAGATKAKAPLKSVARAKADDALNLIAVNEKEALNIVKNQYKKAESLVNKSLDDFGEVKLTSELVGATPGERQFFTRMVDLVEENTKKLTPDELPSDIVGEEVGKQMEYVFKNMKELGKEKGSIIKKISNKKVDINDAVNNLKNRLEDYGVGIKKTKKGNIFDFSESRLRNNTTVQNQVKDFFNWATDKKGNVVNKTVKQVDARSGELFDLTKNRDANLPSFFTSTVENLRSDLGKPISALDSNFGKVNQQYAITRQNFKDILKSTGYKKSIDELPSNLRQLGEFSRRSLGKSSAKTTSALNLLESTAKNLGYKPKSSPKKLAAFGEALEAKFGTPQVTSFKEQVRAGIKPEEIMPTGVVKKAGQALEKLTAETPQQAIKREAGRLRDVTKSVDVMKTLASKAKQPMPKTRTPLGKVASRIPIAGEAISKNKFLSGLIGGASSVVGGLREKQ